MESRDVLRDVMREYTGERDRGGRGLIVGCATGQSHDFSKNTFSNCDSALTFHCSLGQQF